MTYQDPGRRPSRDANGINWIIGIAFVVIVLGAVFYGLNYRDMMSGPTANQSSPSVPMTTGSGSTDSPMRPTNPTTAPGNTPTPSPSR